MLKTSTSDVYYTSPKLSMSMEETCDTFNPQINIINQDEEIYSYFLLRKADVSKIVKYFELNIQHENFSIDSFLDKVSLSNNLILRKILSIVTFNHTTLGFSEFTRLVLYFSILNEIEIFYCKSTPLFVDIQQLFIIHHPELSNYDCFEQYLTLVPTDYLTGIDKEKCSDKYRKDKGDLSGIISMYSFRKIPIPFFIPILEIKANIQKSILSPRRCDELLRLRTNYYSIYKYKQSHGNRDPFTICEHILYLTCHTNPYQYDYSLPYDIFSIYKLPPFVINILKTREHSGFNRNTKISTRPSDVSPKILISSSNLISKEHKQILEKSARPSYNFKSIRVNTNSFKMSNI